jgi:putative oxidoreductase
MPISSTLPGTARFPLVAPIESLLSLANAIPLSIIQLAARVAIARVFWNSSQSKLASWDTTLLLFENEYNVPLLSPDSAALLATTTELCGAIAIVFGLLTRIGALALLCVVAVIQLFVFPGNWGEHLLWASLLLLLVARGAGAISLDHIVRTFLSRRT